MKTEYFSHDYKARHDDKLIRVFMRHGLSGIGAYWCIIEMLYALDKIAPGTASRYTLLYGVEVKFYSARVKLTNELETEGVKNLFTIGDGAGVTRGLIQASASGIHVARVICAR